MDQTTAEFWENHSVRFLEMVVNTDKRGSIDNADGYGNAGRECGDSLEIFLNVEDGTIRSAYFETDGCLYTVACGNAAVHLVEDKTVGEALALTTYDIVNCLETLPEAELHLRRNGHSFPPARFGGCHGKRSPAVEETLPKEIGNTGSSVRNMDRCGTLQLSRRDVEPGRRECSGGEYMSFSGGKYPLFPG